MKKPTDTKPTGNEKIIPMEFPKHECYTRKRMWSARTLEAPCPWHAEHKAKKEKFKRASRERGARRRLFTT